MNILKLREEREALLIKMRGLLDTSAEREFTAEEQESFDNLEMEIETIDKKIDTQARVEKQRRRIDKASTKKTPEQKVQEKYSLSKALTEALNGKLSGVEKEMDQEARHENKTLEFSSGRLMPGFAIPELITEQRTTLTAGTAATAGNLIETSLNGPIIKSLQPMPVCFSAGARVLTGAQGDFEIPRETAAATASWEGETDAAAETNPTYDKLAFTPNRLGAFTPISKQLILQNPFIADAELATLIREATERKLDAALINGQDSGAEPFDGILNLAGIGDVAGGTDGAVPSWANIVGLESEVSTDNALEGSLNYLSTPAIRGVLKTVSKDSGSGRFIMENGNVNGYGLYTSTQVPSNLNKGTSTGVCSAIIFGNFQDMIVARWGGYDIVVDPYTGASTTVIKVYVNSWWDMNVRHVESFAAMKDALLS